VQTCAGQKGLVAFPRHPLLVLLDRGVSHHAAALPSIHLDRIPDCKSPSVMCAKHSVGTGENSNGVQI
jgi:hypothetical protein